jgi:hypothetical protein
MSGEFRGKAILYFTIATVILTAVTSLGGLLYHNTYSRETALWIAQAASQDIVNLALIVPVLLVSAIVARRGIRWGLFVWLGAMLYTAYTFVIYSFGLHFNSLFLVYCWTLGVSAYSFITLTVQITPGVVKGWFDESRHEYFMSLLVLAAGVLFYLMWLKDDLPAMISNQMPAGLRGTGLPTNPVHVLDYSFILPGFIITSVLLLKKKALGYLFAPVLMTFGVLMNLTIAVIAVVMKMTGYDDNVAISMLFAAFALLGIAVLVSFLRHMKKAAA